MDLDDLPIGRVLTRREALTLLGSTGTLPLLGSSPSSSSGFGVTRPRVPCVVRGGHQSMLNIRALGDGYGGVFDVALDLPTR